MVVTYTAFSIRAKAYAIKILIWAAMLSSATIILIDIFGIIPLEAPLGNLPTMCIVLALSYVLNAIVGDIEELIESTVERRTADERKYALECRIDANGRVVLERSGGHVQYIFRTPEVAQSVENEGFTKAKVVEFVDRKRYPLRQRVTFGN